MSDSHNSKGGGNDCMTTWSKVWPPLLVVFVVGFIYTVFMMHAIVPQLNRVYKLSSTPLSPNDPDSYVPSESEILGVVISFHILFFMFLLCFLRSGTSSPGSIPNTDMWKEGKFPISKSDEDRLLSLFGSNLSYADLMTKERRFIKNLPVVERKMKPNRQGASYRFCSTCDMYKPDRTHHCRVCDQCVLRMDHHCPWICNCVGFNNYKVFLLFLFYGSVCCAFIVGAMARRFLKCFRPMLDVQSFVSADLWVIIAWLMALLLFFTLFVFWCFHMGLVFDALSTIERREKKSGGDEHQPEERRAEIRQRWAVAHVKYDCGSGYKNFKHIFGSGWMWLLPIHSDVAGTSGTYSEPSKEKE